MRADCQWIGQGAGHNKCLLCFFFSSLSPGLSRIPRCVMSASPSDQTRLIESYLAHTKHQSCPPQCSVRAEQDPPLLHTTEHSRAERSPIRLKPTSPTWNMAHCCGHAFYQNIRGGPTHFTWWGGSRRHERRKHRGQPRGRFQRRGAEVRHGREKKEGVSMHPFDVYDLRTTNMGD